jgi:hypothetical protein
MEFKISLRSLILNSDVRSIELEIMDLNAMYIEQNKKIFIHLN